MAAVTTTFDLSPLDDCLLVLLGRAREARRRFDLQDILDALRAMGWRGLEREQVVGRLTWLRRCGLLREDMRLEGDLYVRVWSQARGVRQMRGGVMRWRLERRA